MEPGDKGARCLGVPHDPTVKIWLVCVVKPNLGQMQFIRRIVPEVSLKQMAYAAYSGFKSQPIVIHSNRETALRLFLQRPPVRVLFEGVRGVGREQQL